MEGTIDPNGLHNEPSHELPFSVGEEFIQWAEKYWDLEERYTDRQVNPGQEKISYASARESFRHKIDSIIYKRISETPQRVIVEIIKEGYEQ